MEHLQNTKKIPVIVVVGPTASGKTALAVELALRFGGEVISADSMQVYQGMDIATAKPSAEEQKGVPHHLVGYVPPEEPYHLARFVEDARAAVQLVASRGKIPILAGGTGLYIDTFLENRDLGEAGGDEQLREELYVLAREKGNGYLLELLRKEDPETAQVLHENNLVRIVRALEVCRTAGMTMSELQRRSRDREPLYDCCRIGINYRDRQTLYDRINRRVDRMLEAGLIEEAKAFYQSGKKTAVQAIGYKELKPFLDGECSLEEAVGRLKQATRRYAKRQLTWFGRDQRIHWVFPDGDGGWKTACEEAFRVAEGFLKSGSVEE